MKTFKQFIAEIDHDDTAMSKSIVPWNFTAASLDDMDILFRDGELTAKWAKYGRDGWTVAVQLADGKPGMRLTLNKIQAMVPGGTLMGVITQNLTSVKEVRGSGIAFKLYSALVQHGQVLFSSTLQTSGSKRLWEQLVKSGVGEPFVLASAHTADWYRRRNPDYPHQTHNILLTGSTERLLDEAYATAESRLVIVPREHLGKLKKEALQL